MLLLALPFISNALFALPEEGPGNHALNISCSPNQIKQACVALVVNASEAVQEQGEIVIRTYNPDPEHIILAVVDNGTGISEEDKPHIFEPFFSTKHNASGIGLELSIVHGIVGNHRGRIEVESKPGKGSCIEIVLPLSGV